MSEFRLKSELAYQQGWDYDDPKTLDEVKEWAKGQREVVPSVAPPDFPNDEEFFSTFEAILQDYPNVELLFGGATHYIDTVYVKYNNLSNVEDFREFMVLHFRHWMLGGPEENEGICPCCDDRIEMSDERFRNDDNLWAEPDEFDFEEYPDGSKVCRMWWD